MILLRHASAGDRDRWPGDDRKRPLDERGRRQAEAIASKLERYAIERVLTSPARRCVETVQPLAAARGLEVEVREELSEDEQETAGRELVRSLAGTDVLICGHGGLESVLRDPPKWRKGSAFVVDATLAVIDVVTPR